MNYDLVQLEENKAPALFSRERAPNVTDKYNHFTTIDIIEAARSVGWEPYKYGQKKRRQASLEKGLTRESAAHFCTLKPVQMEEPSIFNGSLNNYSAAYPTILLVNAHDGSKALQADLGLVETVCENGMLIFSDNMSNFSWKHTLRNFMDKIKEDLLNMLSYAPWIMHVRNFLCGVPVTQEQAVNLAERTIELRFDGEKYSVNPEDIVRPHFSQQSGLFAYQIFQSVQRSLIRGGDFKVTNKKHLEGVRQGIYNRSPYKKARQIRNFAEERRINKGLWSHVTSWLNDMGYDIPSSENN